MTNTHKIGDKVQTNNNVWMNSGNGTITALHTSDPTITSGRMIRNGTAFATVTWENGQTTQELLTELDIIDTRDKIRAARLGTLSDLHHNRI